MIVFSHIKKKYYTNVHRTPKVAGANAEAVAAVAARTAMTFMVILDILALGGAKERQAARERIARLQSASSINDGRSHDGVEVEGSSLFD